MSSDFLIRYIHIMSIVITYSITKLATKIIINLITLIVIIRIIILLIPIYSIIKVY